MWIRVFTSSGMIYKNGFYARIMYQQRINWQMSLRKRLEEILFKRSCPSWTFKISMLQLMEGWNILRLCNSYVLKL